MSLLLRAVLTITLIAYPFIVYYGLLHFKFYQLTLFIAALALLRIWVLRHSSAAVIKSGLYGAIILLVLSLVAFGLEAQIWLKIYPVVINLLLLLLFAQSLFADKSMIQRFAEFKEKNITEQKSKYMRKLTVIWCVFFVINALIATYTLFLSDKAWMLYNGFISYLMIGALILGELIYRHLVVLKDA